MRKEVAERIGINTKTYCQAVSFLHMTVKFATSTEIITKNLLPGQNPTGPQVGHRLEEVDAH